MSAADLVTQFYALSRVGDFDGAEKLVADDFIIHEAPPLPYGGEWRGCDAFRRLLPTVMGYWTDPEVVIDTIVGDDEQAVAIIRLTMTSPTTGDRFMQHVTEVSRIVDGKIAEMRIHYFDSMEVVRQAGG